MEFENKTVVLSGAASGMSLLLARCFVQQGGNAVMSDIDEKTLAEKVAEINAIRPGSAIGVVCDVRDYAQVCHVCAEAVRVFGTIDLVVNFAGGAELRMLSDRYHGEDLPDIPIDIFDWSLDVNLRGQMYFDHAALAQQARGADIAKIVTFANNEAEEMENLRITTLLKQELKIPFLYLSGGECRLHRRMGALLGNCMVLCVQQYDALATPAQPLLTKMQGILAHWE